MDNQLKKQIEQIASLNIGDNGKNNFKSNFTNNLNSNDKKGGIATNINCIDNSNINGTNGTVDKPTTITCTSNNINNNNNNSNTSTITNVTTSTIVTSTACPTINSSNSVTQNTANDDSDKNRTGKLITCTYCAITFRSRADLRQHCQTETHQNVIMSDEGIFYFVGAFSIIYLHFHFC